MKVSTQLGNLSGNQLLLLLNLGSFELFSVDPKCVLSTVKLKKIFVEVLFIIFVRPRRKIKILLSKENSLFEKRLSDKLTTFPKGSNLVLTFDRSVFLSFLWPLLPVASRGRVLLKYDLNSGPHFVEWRLVLSFLVVLLDD